MQVVDVRGGHLCVPLTTGVYKVYFVSNGNTYYVFNSDTERMDNVSLEQVKVSKCPEICKCSERLFAYKSFRNPNNNNETETLKYEFRNIEIEEIPSRIPVHICVHMDTLWKHCGQSPLNL